jgi:hypothetical protein
VGHSSVSEALRRTARHYGRGCACDRYPRNEGSPPSARERGNAGNCLERPYLRNAGGVRSLAEIERHVLQSLGAPSPVTAVRFRAASALS